MDSLDEKVIDINEMLNVRNTMYMYMSTFPEGHSMPFFHSRKRKSSLVNTFFTRRWIDAFQDAHI